MGCGPTYWRNINPGASWDTDLYECTRAHSTTITSGGGTGLIGSINAAEVGSVRTDYGMRDLCLKSRGWYQDSSPRGPSQSPSDEPRSKARSACPPAEYWNSTRGRCELIGDDADEAGQEDPVRLPRWAVIYGEFGQEPVDVVDDAEAEFGSALQRPKIMLELWREEDANEAPDKGASG